MWSSEQTEYDITNRLLNEVIQNIHEHKNTAVFSSKLPLPIPTPGVKVFYRCAQRLLASPSVHGFSTCVLATQFLANWNELHLTEMNYQALKSNYKVQSEDISLPGTRKARDSEVGGRAHLGNARPLPSLSSRVPTAGRQGGGGESTHHLTGNPFLFQLLRRDCLGLCGFGLSSASTAFHIVPLKTIFCR